MNLLFTICGRAGSKGFKNKNLKLMNGVPLVYYTIAAIRSYINQFPNEKIDVVLNTDSDDLMNIVKKQNSLDIERIFRKSELAGDIVPKVDVIQDTYLAMHENCRYDAIIDLDITSPLRSMDDIRNAINEFFRIKDYDLVYSVVEARRSPYFNMVEKSSDGYYHKVCEGNLTARQQVPKCYEMNASIYVYNPVFLAGTIKKAITQYNCGVSMMRDYRILDIDSEEDFIMMEILHRYYCKKDPRLNEIYLIAKSFV